MNDLSSAPRLLVQATLQPVQGDRFVPANFADLGPAEYFSPQGRANLIVDSVPSMANRLEDIVWDHHNERYSEPLHELPFVTVQHPKHGLLHSVEQPARLGSAYLFPQVSPILEKGIGKLTDQRARNALARTLLRIDPNSLLHGVFLPKLRAAPGLPRLLTASIDARDVGTVESTGARLDSLEEKGRAEDGKGRILFFRREYTSAKVTAHFNLNLYLIRRYGLSPQAQSLLTDLSVYKVLRFLNEGLGLRSGCDLKLQKLTVTAPEDFDLPDLVTLETRLQAGIGQLRASGELGERVHLLG